VKLLDELQIEPLIKAEEAAEYLGFSPLTVRRMAHDGRIPSIAFPVGKTGKYTHRFRASELTAYLTTLERKPVQAQMPMPEKSQGSFKSL
jgi:excisionase family DNA binding protein